MDSNADPPKLAPERRLGERGPGRGQQLSVAIWAPSGQAVGRLGTGHHDRVLFGVPCQLSARRAPPGLLLSVVPRCSSRARRPARVVGVFRELPAWSRLRRMSLRGVRCRVKGQRDIEHYRVGPCDTA